MKLNINGKNYIISRMNIFLLLLILVILLGVVLVYFEKENSEIVVSKESNNSDLIDENEENRKNESKSNDNKIDIYMVGCVNNPGIVTLEKGDLLDEAVKKAGGLTKDADSSKINMVYKIEENMMIKILSKKEIEEIEVEENTGFDAVVDTGDGVYDTKSESNKKSGVVNINTATLDEIKSLPGIGDVLANNVISYREENGGFSSIDELKNVNGIGDKKFEDIKDKVKI